MINYRLLLKILTNSDQIISYYENLKLSSRVKLADRTLLAHRSSLGSGCLKVSRTDL